MRAVTSSLVAGVLALTLAQGAWAATPAERQAYKQALSRAASDFQAARAPCRALAGNARAVCYEEARAARVKAESLAEAEYRNTARARTDADIAIAKADYQVAKKKCGAVSGSERAACLRAARDVQGRTVSESLTRRDRRAP